MVRACNSSTRLFGRVVNLLTRSDHMAPGALWSQRTVLLAIWAAVGVGGILSISRSRYRQSGWRTATHQGDGPLFQPCAALPLSFHGDTQSGRIIKRCGRHDGLFGTWLVFFRDHCPLCCPSCLLRSRSC